MAVARAIPQDSTRENSVGYITIPNGLVMYKLLVSPRPELSNEPLLWIGVSLIHKISYGTNRERIYYT